ncbi:hypothetical protein E2320_011130 [Naja naja]|nr:hypothetical protein E2320_011130 [Naja naja]
MKEVAYVVQSYIKLEHEILEACPLGNSKFGLHWMGSGQFKSDEFMVYFSGKDIGEKGVAFCVNRQVAKCVEITEYTVIA